MTNPLRGDIQSPEKGRKRANSERYQSPQKGHPYLPSIQWSVGAVQAQSAAAHRHFFSVAAVDHVTNERRGLGVLEVRFAKTPSAIGPGPLQRLQQDDQEELDCLLTIDAWV